MYILTTNYVHNQTGFAGALGRSIHVHTVVSHLPGDVPLNTSTKITSPVTHFEGNADALKHTLMT